MTVRDVGANAKLDLGSLAEYQSLEEKAWREVRDRLRQRLGIDLPVVDFIPLDHQTPPEVRDPKIRGRWDFWVILGGRGSGKTRGAVEYVMDHLREIGPQARVGVGAPTIGLAREVCFEGESGLMTLCGHEFVKYNRNTLEAWHKDGGYVKGLGAESPTTWNGPQWSLLWADELALWKEESWDQAQFGTRLGSWPRSIVTTTPKQRRFVRDLVEAGTKIREDRDGKSMVRRVTVKDDLDGAEFGEILTATDLATTYDNTYLPAKRLAYFRVKYEGTRLGRQELRAQFLDEVEGSLWKLDQIAELREWGSMETWRDLLDGIVVAVDPSGGSKGTNDEVGIVVVGYRKLGKVFHYYTLHDASGHYTPDTWGRKAVRLYEVWGASAIVGERNYGGDMVKHVVRTVDKSVVFREVWASKGKRRRFEPVAALAEQGRDHHVGEHAQLEDEMVTWDPDNPDEFSPNRADAKCWGVSYFMKKYERPDKKPLPGSHSHRNLAA